MMVFLIMVIENPSKEYMHGGENCDIFNAKLLLEEWLQLLLTNIYFRVPFSMCIILSYEILI